jgi:hypothetical protein
MVTIPRLYNNDECTLMKYDSKDADHELLGA